MHLNRAAHALPAIGAPGTKKKRTLGCAPIRVTSTVVWSLPTTSVKRGVSSNVSGMNTVLLSMLPQKPWLPLLMLVLGTAPHHHSANEPHNNATAYRKCIFSATSLENYFTYKQNVLVDMWQAHFRAGLSAPPRAGWRARCPCRSGFPSGSPPAASRAATRPAGLA